MAQQTAVEWLISELQIRLLKIKSEPNGIVRETMINNFLIDTEQAKQMEKEQIMEAYLLVMMILLIIRKDLLKNTTTKHTASK